MVFYIYVFYKIMIFKKLHVYITGEWINLGDCTIIIYFVLAICTLFI